MNAQTATAPVAKDSAPNKQAAGAKAAAPDKKAWSAEIVTNPPEYNANLPVDDCVPDPENRKPEDAAADAQLADSVKADGLVQPIAVRPCPRFPRAYVAAEVGRKFFHVWSSNHDSADPKAHQDLYATADRKDADRVAAIYKSGAGWQIIAGERRWRAHRRNGAKTIRAFIHRGETNASAAVKQTVENSTRLDLNPIEEARQMKRLEAEGIPQKEIGKRFGGKSQPVVSQMLKLLAFPAEVQALFASGELTPAHGEGLGRFIPWREACVILAKEAVRCDMEAKAMRGEIWGERALAEMGLGAVIYTGNYSYDARPQYKVSTELAKQPGFFKAGWEEYFYLYPEDPKANLWAPEKAKQDAARAAAAKKSASKEGAKQSGMTPAEKAARNRKLAVNKQARTESALAHVAVLQRIKDLKDFDGACIAVIAETAFGAHWKYGSSERIKNIANKLGIKMPSGSGLEVPRLSKMKALDILRLAAACICDRESEDSIKAGFPIADQVQCVLGDKQTKVLRGKAEQAIAAAAAKKEGKKS